MSEPSDYDSVYQDYLNQFSQSSNHFSGGRGQGSFRNDGRKPGSFVPKPPPQQDDGQQAYPVTHLSRIRYC